ncbi:MAG: hypothetical protein HY904_25270 [Deltaproteobacteria bacterium]|nr:hypothetical protein [Deltaproteobacteria bacterium]
MAAWVALGPACPSHAPECNAAADCGPLVAGTSSRAPETATTYCVGGTCTPRPSGTHHLVADVVTPAGVPLRSVRYAVVHPRSAARAVCERTQDCPAATVTCQDLRDSGLDAPRGNVALAGVRDVDTRNGTWTSFGGLELGDIPDGQQWVAVEGRTGQQGNGDRGGWFCALFTPVGLTARVAAQLAPLSVGDAPPPASRRERRSAPAEPRRQRAGVAPGIHTFFSTHPRAADAAGTERP